MADSKEPKRGKIPIREFLADFRSRMTDRELREKYDLSARNFVSLIKALVESRMVSQQDLSIRRQMSVQRDLAKESEFLSQLFICPFCSHPSPHSFETCPACGGKISTSTEFMGPFDAGRAAGGHFAEESEDSVTQEVEIIEEEEATVEREASQPEEPPREESGSKPEEAEPGRKYSLSTLRSLLSKLKKS